MSQRIQTYFCRLDLNSFALIYVRSTLSGDINHRCRCWASPTSILFFITSVPVFPLQFPKLWRKQFLAVSFLCFPNRLSIVARMLGKSVWYKQITCWYYLSKFFLPISLHIQKTLFTRLFLPFKVWICLLQRPKDNRKIISRIDTRKKYLKVPSKFLVSVFNKFIAFLNFVLRESKIFYFVLVRRPFWYDIIKFFGWNVGFMIFLSY